MAMGRVVRFDRARGFGFIAPDGGGEDVFVHASDLESDGNRTVTSGMQVEFEVFDSGRGLKAYDVRVVNEPVKVGAAASAATRALAAGAGADEEEDEPDSEDDDTYEVLSANQFSREVTELIITASPSTTGGQIAEIRAALASLARRHGWVD